QCPCCVRVVRPCSVCLCPEAPPPPALCHFLFFPLTCSQSPCLFVSYFYLLMTVLLNNVCIAGTGTWTSQQIEVQLNEKAVIRQKGPFPRNHVADMPFLINPVANIPFPRNHVADMHFLRFVWSSKTWKMH